MLTNSQARINGNEDLEKRKRERRGWKKQQSHVAFHKTAQMCQISSFTLSFHDVCFIFVRVMQKKLMSLCWSSLQWSGFGKMKLEYQILVLLFKTYNHELIECCCYSTLYILHLASHRVLVIHFCNREHANLSWLHSVFLCVRKTEWEEWERDHLLLLLNSQIPANKLVATELKMTVLLTPVV